MRKKDDINTKSSRFELRLYPVTIEIIDNYRRNQKIIISRAEAIRRLLEIGLKVEESK